MANTSSLIVQGRISLAVLAVGLVLLAYMVVEEGEPGALPLFLMLAGGGGYAISRYRSGKGAR